MKKRLVHCVRV